MQQYVQGNANELRFIIYLIFDFQRFKYIITVSVFFSRCNTAIDFWKRQPTLFKCLNREIDRVVPNVLE